MITFKFTVRVLNKRGSFVTTVYEQGLNMQAAFAVVLHRMDNVAYIKHQEIK